MKAVDHYIMSFYNERRKNSTLGYYSPNKFEYMYNQLATENVSPN
ncbi:hypothetical protein [Viridibacillus soli]